MISAVCIFLLFQCVFIPKLRVVNADFHHRIQWWPESTNIGGGAGVPNFFGGYRNLGWGGGVSTFFVTEYQKNFQFPSKKNKNFPRLGEGGVAFATPPRSGHH